MPDDNPLTDQDLQSMNEGLEKLKVAESLIEKSIRAGIDMSEQAKRTREVKEQLTRIKQTFFPGR